VIDRPDSSDNTLSGAPPQSPAEAAPAIGQVVVYFEGQVLRTLPLNVPVVTIGRTPGNVLPLPHPSVSRSHAELRVTPEAVIVTDTGSANGTYIDDARLAPQQPVQLTSGAVIRIGPFLIRYEAAVAVPSESMAAAAVEERAAPQAPPPVPVQMPPTAFVPPPPVRPRHPVRLPSEPVSSYLDFLPVFFQDGDFLGRFLLIFQSIWEPLEYRQDHLAMYFDPRTCPTPFLNWLADWLGVNAGPVSDEGRLRMLLGEAVELYRWRGTRYGLTRLIELCTGVTPLVTEAVADPAVLHIRVALPPESNVDRDTIERLIRAHKPAHTAYILEVVS